MQLNLTELYLQYFSSLELFSQRERQRDKCFDDKQTFRRIHFKATWYLSRFASSFSLGRLLAATEEDMSLMRIDGHATESFYRARQLDCKHVNH